MANYLLIESRDPYEYADTGYFYDLATDLAAGGNEVTFFLIQNGVLVTRRGANSGLVQKLSGAGKIRILADEFSLRERGITRDRLVDDVQASSVDDLVDLLMTDGTKAIWH